VCKGLVVGGMGGGKLAGSQFEAKEWGGEVRVVANCDRLGPG